MSVPDIDFTRFYRYEELAAHLRALAAWRPEWCRLRSIGRSLEGRDMLLLEISDPSTGPAADKPAFLLHGNLHANELSGSTCALFLAHRLLAASDDLARRLLSRVAFHIIPRACPDGAEAVLAQEYRPRSREVITPRKNCLSPQDLNGDGLIHKMRVPDPEGPWFAPDDEPRLLVPRLPGDQGGKRYRLTVEGLIHDWDGGPWEDPCAIGFDFNRNWAANWRPRHEQWGAGRYPFSEPEVRALADHILDTPNLFAAFAFHTGTQAVLRPPASGPDSGIGDADLFMLRRLAALGEKITGFPAMAVTEYHNKLAPAIRLHGAFMEWAYCHCGLLAMDVELGYIYSSAGYTAARFFSQTPEDERQRERDILALHDAHPEWKLFAPWQPFDHPQLGPVEIGGWRPAEHGNVVPPERVPIWEKSCEFILQLAERGPWLRIRHPTVEALGGGLHRVTCRVVNDGFLPTHVTALGAGLSHVDGVRVEIEREGEIVFVAGRNRVEVGHLAASDGRDLVWVIRAPKGGRITLTAHAPRAGTDRVALVL